MIEITASGTRFFSGLALGCALALTACSVSSPLTVQSGSGDRSASLGAPQAIKLISLGDEETGQRRAFAEALTASFADRGIAASDDAQFIADFAISSGAASLGVQVPRGPDADPEGERDWVDVPRPRKRFDKCGAQELRGTLMLTDRTSGAVVYRGRGMATECGFDDSAIRSLADILVADLVERS